MERRRVNRRKREGKTYSALGNALGKDRENKQKDMEIAAGLAHHFPADFFMREMRWHGIHASIGSIGGTAQAKFRRRAGRLMFCLRIYLYFHRGCCIMDSKKGAML